MASKIFRSCEDFGCFTIVQSFSPVGLLAQVCQQLPLSQRLLFVSSKKWQGKSGIGTVSLWSVVWPCLNEILLEVELHAQPKAAN